MHRLELRTYAGTPQEQVTVTTAVQGSGHVLVQVDGQDIGNVRQFPLKNNPGDQTEMRITLFGAVGDSCAIGVSTVDGGTDGDLLLCQVHDPFPVHRYDFMVASEQASNALKSVGSAPPTKTVKHPGGRK